MQDLIGKSLNQALNFLSDDPRKVAVSKNDSKGENPYDDELIVQVRENENEIVLITSKFKIKA